MGALKQVASSGLERDARAKRNERGGTGRVAGRREVDGDSSARTRANAKEMKPNGGSVRGWAARL